MDLKDIVSLNKSGTLKALPSFCTANDHVLNAIVSFGAKNDLPILIEATCNQVNQFGGYTGMRPANFAAKIHSILDENDYSSAKLILGGDHLGPNPWKHLPAAEAMENAKTLVKDYVQAGFTKIHLDASMACGSEGTPSFELVAKRSAELCVVAEKYAPNSAELSYVIGTEVPVPGGESDDMSGIVVTTQERLKETIETHIAAFAIAGVSQGIEKAIAVVVQPGVDFSHERIFHYDQEKATTLTSAINQYEGFAFEAHSTDYQSTENLAKLVIDHSVVLKVGPEITFRFREAIMALAHIEDELELENPSFVMATILNAMRDEPADWKSYYQGTSQEIDFLQKYSYSDRIRYYWDKEDVAQSLAKLIHNLKSRGISPTIASLYSNDFPVLEERMDPNSLITQRISSTTERYYRASGWL